MEVSDADDGIREDADVVVCVASTEYLAINSTQRFSKLQSKKKSRVFNYLNGPYKQHQFLLHCVAQLKKLNGIDKEIKGRLLPVSPDPSSIAGSLFASLLWLVSLCLPIAFIIACCVQYDTWLVCGCAIILSLLISCHSIIIFFILHNQKIAQRMWFINKISLQHYCGCENNLMEVTLDNAMTMQFLSASQKSQVIARLARSKAKKGMLMMCSRSFWVSHIRDPLLSLLIVIVISLASLIVCIDLIRRHES